MISIRPAVGIDWPEIWAIFRYVVAAGDTFAFAPDTSESTAKQLWMTPPAAAYVAVDDGGIVGTSFIRPVQPGLGSHVANAGFMVAARARGNGIGRAMGSHAIEEARRLGYRAMQFNFVVSTNQRAVRLWESLGFAIAGTIPDAFRHATNGLVAVHIMHRKL